MKASVVVVAFLIAVALATVVGTATLRAGGQATILSPSRVGGAGGSDERAVDTYPAVAYDSTTQRYLVVWTSVRNAGSASDGLDVYGLFLDPTGQSTGSEFRISDANTVARGGLPVVAAGTGEFVVAWASRGTRCQVAIQRVTDGSARADQVLVSGPGHNHSPSLVYHPARQRYVLAFVEGDDYLPPTFSGAETADCGNNASSPSRIKAVEFAFSGDRPTVTSTANVSSVSGGAFRPRLAYSAGLSQYLAVWEDRRSASGQAYRFDLYAQRLSAAMALTESNLALAAGGTYENLNTSATWTPRPAVSGGGGGFLATWFAREVQGNAVIWSVVGRLVAAGGAPASPVLISQMPFALSHQEAPTGFLAATYASSVQEHLVGMTSHLESAWGYLSFARIQRVSASGQLMKMDGTVQSQTGVGYSVDYENESQVGIGLGVTPADGSGTTNALVVYAKHRRSQPAQDLDIWGVRVQVAAGGPTNTPTSTTTAKSTATAIATATTPIPRLYLPAVFNALVGPAPGSPTATPTAPSGLPTPIPSPGPRLDEDVRHLGLASLAPPAGSNLNRALNLARLADETFRNRVSTPSEPTPTATPSKGP